MNDDIIYLLLKNVSPIKLKDDSRISVDCFELLNSISHNAIYIMEILYININMTLYLHNRNELLPLMRNVFKKEENLNYILTYSSAFRFKMTIELLSAITECVVKYHPTRIIEFMQNYLMNGKLINKLVASNNCKKILMEYLDAINIEYILS